MKTSISWTDIEQEIQKYSYPNDAQKIIIFGAGFNGQTIASLLQKEGVPIAAFCDNDVKKWNTEIAGLPCIPPGAQASQNTYMLVAALDYWDAIRKQLSDLHIPCCTVDAYVIRRHLSSFNRVYHMLDEVSQQIYAAVLLSRIRGDRTILREFCSDAQYFALPEFRYPTLQEVFVDCGAFTGEDSQKFLQNVAGHFQKIYAFEGNPKAIEAMKWRFAHEKNIWLFNEEQIVCERRFVAAQTGLRIPFHISENNPSNSRQGWEDSDYVETVSLDQYFYKRGEERITFLKADIEGAEWDMLHGAAQVIQYDKPKIAVSIYHSIYDLFRIPLLLKEWVPEYHFAVRHHWYNFVETVLYCYV